MKQFKNRKGIMKKNVKQVILRLTDEQYKWLAQRRVEKNESIVKYISDFVQKQMNKEIDNEYNNPREY